MIAEPTLFDQQTTEGQPDPHEGETLDEEVAWLRSFGWPLDRIAESLGVPLNTLQQRTRRREATK